MATIVSRFEAPWSHDNRTTTRRPDGTLVTETDRPSSGTVPWSETRVTAGGKYPYLSHNPYSVRRTPAAIVFGKASLLTTRSTGTTFQTLEGSFGDFLSWTGAPRRPDLTWTVPTRLEILATLDMYNQLSDAKVGLGQMLAELKKTSVGVASTLTTLTRAVTAAKRRNWKQVLWSLGIKRHNWRANANNVGARWLEVQFGWKPLIMDIHDLISYADTIWQTSLTYSCKGKSYERVDDKYERPSENGSRMVTLVGRRGYSVQCTVRVNNSSYQTIAAHGLKPVPTAWELAPWSFLYDYIVPIGDWLNALSAMDGLQWLSGSSTSLYDVLHTETEKGLWTKGNNRYFVDMRSKTNVFNLNRRLLTEPPRVQFAMKVPLQSWKQAGNVVALLLAQLRR